MPVSALFSILQKYEIFVPSALSSYSDNKKKSIYFHNVLIGTPLWKFLALRCPAEYECHFYGKNNFKPDKIKR